MSSFPKALLAIALVLGSWHSTSLADDKKYPGIGRAATPKEVAAWDIDVRPDFKGLPAGAGSVAKGQEVWESKCAHCHGVFGESNEVFSPLVGGTTAQDIKTGRVANLSRSDYPGRTTLMKVATLSTLWDYINRAMPWTAPKSLTTEEVYAVTAFLLNLGGVVPDEFTLSDQNMAEVQQRMPNRHGMNTRHAMWPGREFSGTKKTDTQNTACMKNCQTEASVSSLLPDFARNAHGNLALQNRVVGAQHGVDTSRVATVSMAAPQAPATPLSSRKASEPPPGVDAAAVQLLLQKHSCTACHAQTSKVVGPSFADIAAKHAGKIDYLAGKIKSGGSGLWGAVPMPPQSLSDPEAQSIAAWLAAGAVK